MTETERIELAKAYVALSNAHRVDLIVPMFAEDAVYVSTNVGEFRGARAIGDMMSGFFARFPDVHWEASGHACAPDGDATFEFTMTATDGESAEAIHRAGSEVMRFTDDGLIARLEVESR